MTLGKEFFSSDRNVPTDMNILPVTDMQEFLDSNKNLIPLTGTLFQNIESFEFLYYDFVYFLSISLIV